MTDRTLMFMLWGGGCVIVFSIVFSKRWLNYRRHRRDRRKSVRRDVRKDVVSGFALFLSALGSAAAVGFVLLGEAGSTPRSFALALALGAFFGAGIIMATEEDANGTA